MTYAGYITGFPFDSRESILRDLEILKRELRDRGGRDLLPDAATGLGGSSTADQHRRLMDPDMPNNIASERVTHHTKMSDEEWEHAYHDAWKSYYNPEHIRDDHAAGRGEAVSRSRR